MGWALDWKSWLFGFQWSLRRQRVYVWVFIGPVLIYWSWYARS